MTAVPPARPALRVLVIGGTSEIALGILGALADRHTIEAELLGRDHSRLEAVAVSLRGAGARVSTEVVEATDLAAHAGAIDRAAERLGRVDLVILAIGLLGDRGGLPTRIADGVTVLEVTFLGAGSLLLHAARRLSEQRGGTLLVLSSVAAERPRRSNAVYGAAKAGLDALAQGLSDALAPHGVEVVVVRPGFVHTRMTAGLPAAPLSTTVSEVALAADRALRQGGSRTVWVPGSLRWVMAVMRLVPRPLWRRLEL